MLYCGSVKPFVKLSPHHWPPRGTAPGWEACAQSQEAIPTPPHPTGYLQVSYLVPNQSSGRGEVSVVLSSVASQWTAKKDFATVIQREKKLQTATSMLPFFNPKVKAVRLRV